jgi:hypothetical protein
LHQVVCVDHATAGTGRNLESRCDNIAWAIRCKRKNWNQPIGIYKEYTTEIWPKQNKGRVLAINTRIYLGSSVNHYVILPDVEIGEEKITRIFNIYIQWDVQSAICQLQKITWHRVIRQRGNTIVEGHFMWPSSRWGRGC